VTDTLKPGPGAAEGPIDHLEQWCIHAHLAGTTAIWCSPSGAAPCGQLRRTAQDVQRAEMQTDGKLRAVFDRQGCVGNQHRWQAQRQAGAAGRQETSWRTRTRGAVWAAMTNTDEPPTHPQPAA